MLLESSTWHSTLFFLTWKVKATPQGRLLFQLAQSAPSTSERECLSWPTLRAGEADHGGPNSRDSDGRPHLSNLVSWPTLRRAGNRNSRSTMTAMHFAAPALEQAIEINDGKLPREFSSIDELSPKAFHTLIASDGGMIADPKKGGNRPLRDVAAYPTLTSRDYRSAEDLPGRHGGSSLAKTLIYPTLTATRRSGLQSNGHNAFLGMLNPEWCEMFMGFPIGWTDLGGPRRWVKRNTQTNRPARFRDTTAGQIALRRSAMRSSRKLSTNLRMQSVKFSKHKIERQVRRKLGNG